MLTYSGDEGFDAAEGADHAPLDEPLSPPEPTDDEPPLEPPELDELPELDPRSTALPVRSGPLARLSGSARSALPRCAQAGEAPIVNAATLSATSNLPRVMTRSSGAVKATNLPPAELQVRCDFLYCTASHCRRVVTRR
jgi:hypothetical protein